jgi:hypothetical protein
MGALAERRTSSTTITNHQSTATASLLLDEFRPIQEQEEVTTTTTQPPSSPPSHRDSFYDDLPDVVRVFALDYDRLYHSFCQRTALYAFNAVVKLGLVYICVVDTASPSTVYKVIVISTSCSAFSFRRPSY